MIVLQDFVGVTICFLEFLGVMKTILSYDSKGQI
jgi:hypothetical protein